jgi:hypothetical protein
MAEARRWIERGEVCGAGSPGWGRRSGLGSGIGAARLRMDGDGWTGREIFLDGNPAWGPQNSPQVLTFCTKFQSPQMLIKRDGGSNLVDMMSFACSC